MPESGIDMLMGIGSSAEAVLASAAIKTLGGEMLSRFFAKDEKLSMAWTIDLNKNQKHLELLS